MADVVNGDVREGDHSFASTWLGKNTSFTSHLRIPTAEITSPKKSTGTHSGMLMMKTVECCPLAVSATIDNQLVELMYYWHFFFAFENYAHASDISSGSVT